MNVLLASLLGAAALITAGISGFLGMGGGITLLGVMSLLLPAHQVVPLHGVVQLVSNGSRTAFLLPHVRGKVLLSFVPTLVLGTALATQFWANTQVSWLRIAVGVVLLGFVALRWAAVRPRAFPIWVYVPLGLGVGVLALFVGATGPLIAPFFLRDDWDRREIVATKSACQLVTHFLKIPAFLLLGFNYLEHLPLLLLLVGAVVVGTWIGTRLLDRIPDRAFIRVFELALFVLGVFMIAREVAP